jgi:hypothetical protein
LTVIEPFQWLGYLELRRIQKYNTNYRLFSSMHVPVWSTWPCTMCRRGGLSLHDTLYSSCQLPSFQDSFFWFRQLRLLNGAIFQFDHGQTNSILRNALVPSSVVIDESTVMWTLPLSFWFLGWFKGFYDSCKHFLTFY